MSQQELSREVQEIWALFREVAKHQEEASAQIREVAKRQEEFAKQHSENDSKFKDLRELFTGQWGKLVEALVEPSVLRLFQERGRYGGYP